MTVRTSIRLEGAAVFLLATAAFFAVSSGPLWLYFLLLFAPDVGMVGYLAGPRVGALTYNLVHVYVGPLALAAGGYYAGVDVAVLVALVWLAHVGGDRALGYGLKYPTGFHETHVGRL